ncbi:hypothetical protein CsatB_008925 [Cannabis sativa]|uniref:uncharacterized protein LOC115702352 isoform X1 n=1 Tax=Cannabis sativa TaxID=3483 RepID=UPI0011DF5A7F|nr:uncharacterized protein LOC115702352 isoform X1 [Cannabis sativa]
MKDGKQKKKINTTEYCNSKGVSWQEMKYLADTEEGSLKQDIQDLKSWAMMESRGGRLYLWDFICISIIRVTNMIDSMNEEKLKEYIENRPVELKTVKIQKNNNTPRPKIQRIGKSTKASNNGIMASVWKFHKDHDDDYLNLK